MSYLVLARKYRSTGFDDVVAQEHVAQTLKRAIETDRIAHAFLFCGTRGVGKTSMARILAKALNCEKSKGPTAKPCGTCTSCVAIARGDDMDVIEIDAASNTQVEKTREIISNAQFHPARSRFKIYIIDEVHMLSRSSFNALLKTLEEPPGHVKFILATTEPEKIPATILSRCQRYDFRSISTRQIADHLKTICQQEKIKADDEALLLLARAGAGSMRDALSLLDRMLSAGESKVSVELIEQMLGMPRAQVIFDIVQAIGEADVKQVLALADQQLAGGMSADALVAAIIEHLRNLLIVAACGADSKLIEVPGLATEELSRQAGQFEPAILVQDIAILEELRRSLRASGAGRALFDATLARLALAKQFAPLSQLLNGVPNPAPAALKKKSDALTPGQEPSPCVQEEGVSVEPISLADTDAIWRTLLQLLAAKSAGLPAMLRDAKLTGIEDGTAVIQFAHDHETLTRSFERNGKKDLIRAVLCDLLKCNVGVRFVLGEPPSQAEPIEEPEAVAAGPVRRSPPPAADAGSTRLTPELKQALAANPLVAAVIEHLGGEIIKVE